MTYEYKVIPAPARGKKGKGLKTVEDRFAHALEEEINGLAAQGWEYVRADTLPCEQREGLMSKTTVYQNMLVFRRAKTAGASAPAPVASPTPRPVPTPTPPVRKPVVAKAEAPAEDGETPKE